jgi:hypothetical protein
MRHRSVPGFVGATYTLDRGGSRGPHATYSGDKKAAIAER